MTAFAYGGTRYSFNMRHKKYNFIAVAGKTATTIKLKYDCIGLFVHLPKVKTIGV